ncbi:MAG TPA: PTS transporter subunit EIIB [Bacilli bacterium]|nr:PTS transporter subunit EIIB [Bacilli bacterium]
MWIKYLVISIVLIIIAFVVIKSGKKDFKIEANKLVEFLGGKQNIVSLEASMSRFKAVLKDPSLVNKEGIQKLGARGIVEIDNQLKIVFDSNANKLKKCIEELMRQNVLKK